MLVPRGGTIISERPFRSSFPKPYHVNNRYASHDLFFPIACGRINRMAHPLTTQEAADKLGVTRTRILQFIRENRLPAEKHGRDWMIQVADLAKVRDRKPGRPPTKAKK